MWSTSPFFQRPQLLVKLEPTVLNGHASNMIKQDFRSALLTQRKQLGASQVQANSEHVVKHIINSELWQDSRHIAIYFPFNGEIDLSPLLKETTKDIYLPAIKGQSMQFHCHRPNLILRPHRFGILQPDYVSGHESHTLDLCLMPLVGFDFNGNRLGMGGGYYDRFFANKPPTIMAGVAHSFQHISQLPTDPWDVKLQHIFTEQGHKTI